MITLLQSGTLFLLLFLVSLPLHIHLPGFVHVCAVVLAVDLLLMLLQRNIRFRGHEA